MEATVSDLGTAQSSTPTLWECLTWDRMETWTSHFRGLVPCICMQ
jgi:hypothetical protein